MCELWRSALHDNSIRAVAHRLVDGAAVDSLVPDNLLATEPDLGDRVRVAVGSPPLGMRPAVAPALDGQRLRNTPLVMHQYRGRRAVPRALWIHCSAPVRESAYDTVRRMLDDLGGQ